MYPGATAQDVADAVAAPIEAQLSGLQGLLYFTSANASDGTMFLQIYFDVGRSQDLAAVDVQNAVQLAQPQLPDAVRQNGITILKANSDILAVVGLTLSLGAERTRLGPTVALAAFRPRDTVETLVARTAERNSGTPYG